MVTLTRPAFGMPETLEIAHTILRRNMDHHLAQKTMTLEGYLDLSWMNPGA